MSESTSMPRERANDRHLEEKSLLGSAYSFVDIGQVSTQDVTELANDGDD